MLLIYGCTSTPQITECENISTSEQITVFSLSSNKFCDTTMSLKKNTAYIFFVDSISNDWADGDKHDALSRPELNETGWIVDQLPWYFRGVIFAEPFRKCPNGQWFEIIGEVIQPSGTKVTYRLGDGMRYNKILLYKGSDDGRLIIYANDLNSRYDNNYGKITISFRRANQEELNTKQKMLTCE